MNYLQVLGGSCKLTETPSVTFEGANGTRDDE
jgi:hypothetical protein